MTVDGVEVAQWAVLDVRAGSVVAIGALDTAGARAYLLVAGGIDCPAYLGSRSTFTLGQFGGHAGRVLRTGDVLRLAAPATARAAQLPGGAASRLRW